MIEYDQPVGTILDRSAPTVWAGAWVDATGFATLYKDSSGTSAYHTGADLNLNVPVPDNDAHAPVYAAGEGQVVFASTLATWGGIVCIKHFDGYWTRYGHVENILVGVGDHVLRGTQIAQIGRPASNPPGPYHLHFDVAKIDLGKTPGDWPRLDLARLKRNYVDPRKFINDRRPVARGLPRVQYGRTYNALHPSVTLDQAKRILESVWANGETLGKSFDDGGIGDLDTRVVKLWNIPASEQANFKNFYATYYPGVVVSFFTSDQTPPAETTRPALGLHVIHRHDIAQRELANGCPMVLVMDGKVSARDMARAYPKAIIVYRRWIGTSWPDPATMANLLEVSSDDPPNLKYVALNEGDAPGTGDIAARAAWEMQLVDEIKRRGSKARLLAPSWGHGNPPGDFETIWAPVGAAYARRYNNGDFDFDIHGYSCGRPIRGGQFEPPIYYETRWKRLFTHAGFDPRVRNIYTTETGIEGGCKAGGVGGGFPANNYTESEFRAWVEYWYSLQIEPITIGGISYPSPFRGGVVFQAGDTNTLLADTSTPDWVRDYWAFEIEKRATLDFVESQTRGGWAGYNVDRSDYLNVLRSYWVKP